MAQSEGRLMTSQYWLYAGATFYLVFWVRATRCTVVRTVLYSLDLETRDGEFFFVFVFVVVRWGSQLAVWPAIA